MIRRHALVQRLLVVIVCGTVLAGCRLRTGEPEFTGEPYLIVWAGDADRQHSDFLAVIDADPRSETYGHVVATMPVGSRGNEPHAMEAHFAPDGLVFAGGLLSDRTFVFDVHEPSTPRLVHVDTPGPERRFGTPRAYVRLQNGNRVATCGDRRGYRGGVVEMLEWAGGLVQFDAAGRFLREIEASDPTAAGLLLSPHGIAISWDTDRLLLTDGGHGYAATALEWSPGISVQIREASSGELLDTLPLPVGDRGDENLGPRNAHFLLDGDVALVSTAEGAGLYASRGMSTTAPVFKLVYDFGRGSLAGRSAVTPNEHLYVQALTGTNRLVALDISDPFKPRRVGRLRFDRNPARPGRSRKGGPHGVALSVDGRRVAVSDYTIDVPALYRDGDRRVYLVNLDLQSGHLSFDKAFRDEIKGSVGVNFGRRRWPHGATGAARPAAMLFVAPVELPES
jgi:hypothetical protein